MPEIFQFFYQPANAFIDFMRTELIYSAVIFAIVFVVTRFTRTFSPALNFMLWLLVFIRLILPTNFSLPISAWQFLPDFKGKVLSELSAPQIENLITNPGFSENVIESGAAVVNLDNTESAANQAVPSQESSTKWPVIVFLAWLAGVSFLVFFYIRELFLFHNRTRRAQPITDSNLLEYRDYWQNRTGVTRPVQLKSSDAFLSPFTLGIFRPVIFLPRQLLAEANLATLNTIIAHEMVHIQRFDDLWLKLQNLIQILYFFNPLVWFAAAELNQERERLCDNRVLAEGSISRTTYGESMLRVLKLNLFGFDGVALLPGFGSEKKRFASRLQSILKNQKQARISMISIILIFLGSSTFLLPMANYEKPAKAGSIAGITEEKTGAVLQSTALNFHDPLQGVGFITARYGKMKTPFSDAATFHTATDIKAKMHTPVFAAEAGIVTKARTDYVIDKGFGRLVEIQHANGFVSRYAHLKKVLIEVGQEVKAGTQIGSVGTTGKSTGPHLHFEILKSSDNLNPELYVGFNQELSKKAQKQFVIRKKSKISFAQPVQGRITSNFGERRDPFTKENRKHRGLDVAQKHGTPILATAAGRISNIVLDNSDSNKHGHFVEIIHANGFLSRYTHMDQISVKPNQEVKSGEIIGTVGNTGLSTGAHVHFEIELDGAFVNPMEFINN
ncbi:MAG: hypothetical protein DWQ05_18920 [Calditrichaeota bacterium]|nr:MAG: hypothetical protein DWQ05_18920 [Calditrichota bacterium]